MDDYKKEFFCEYLEDSMDKQDHLTWSARDWDPDKLRSYMACCFALPYFVRNDREVLTRMLCCLCDAESGGVQTTLISACEAYCENPYENDIFILEVVKVAPEMLKRSVIYFGRELFQYMLNHCVNDISHKLYLSALTGLETIEEKQVIIDFLVYLTEQYPIDGSDNEKYHKLLADSLHVTGLKGGNSKYFNEY